MLAPTGAPASSEYVNVCTPPSASDTTGVKLNSAPSGMLRLPTVPMTGARFGCLT